MSDMSNMILDVLENKPGFPDFSFVIYGSGYYTHHIITQRETRVVGEVSGTGFQRLNYSPGKGQLVDRYFVEMMFEVIPVLNQQQYQNRLVSNQLGLIPMEGTLDKILAFGKLLSTNNFSDGTIERILDVDGTDKRLKVYNPPDAVSVRVGDVRLSYPKH